LGYPFDGVFSSGLVLFGGISVLQHPYMALVETPSNDGIQLELVFHSIPFHNVVSAD
jgi:hypothetical protein